MKGKKTVKRYKLVSWYEETATKEQGLDEITYNSREKAVSAMKEEYDTSMIMEADVCEEACRFDSDAGTAEFWWKDGWIKYWKIVEEARVR